MVLDRVNARMILGVSARMILGGVVALSALGCGSEPSGLGQDLLLSFTAEGFDPSQGSVPSDAAQGGAGTITITGGLQGPCLAQASDLKGEAQREGLTLLLQVTVEPEGACTPGISAFTYEALLGNLESGTYNLTVTHVFSAGVGYVALETSVVVR